MEPENRPKPQRKRKSLPSIHFQVRSHVSFREGSLGRWQMFLREIRNCVVKFQVSVEDQVVKNSDSIYKKYNIYIFLYLYTHILFIYTYIYIYILRMYIYMIYVIPESLQFRCCRKRARPSSHWERGTSVRDVSSSCLRFPPVALIWIGELANAYQETLRKRHRLE